MKKLKISSIKSLGIKDVYNIEMKSDQHNYFVTSEVTGTQILMANSHAYAYAVLAVQCAYLKAHYPLYYMKAVLNTETLDSKLDVVERYMKDCLRMKIQMLPCNVNKSRALFTVENKALRIGLASLKGVGMKASEIIEQLAPFKDFEDFVERTLEESNINKKVVEVLMYNGAFADFNLQDEEGLEMFLKIRKSVEYRKKRNIQKSSMFDDGCDLSSVSFS